MKTLKREEIYANRYDDLKHLRKNIEEFMNLAFQNRTKRVVGQLWGHGHYIAPTARDLTCTRQHGRRKWEQITFRPRLPECRICCVCSSRPLERCPIRA
jgi:hypothetical protein